MVFTREREGRLLEGSHGPSSLCDGFAPTPLEAGFLQGIVKVALRSGWVALRHAAALGWCFQLGRGSQLVFSTGSQLSAGISLGAALGWYFQPGCRS